MISALLSGDQGKIVTMPVRYGVNVSEVLFYLHSHNASELLSLHILSNSDKYNIFLSKDFGLDDSNDDVEKALPIDILESPESKLILDDQAEAQINFTMQANTDINDIAILARHDLTLEDSFQSSYDYVVLSSNEPQSLFTDVTCHVSVTAGSGSAVAKTLNVHFHSFNASKHYGLYCLQIYKQGSHSNRRIVAAACVDVIPAHDNFGSTFEPGIQIDVCSNVHSGQTKSLALFKEQTDCIACTVVGLDNPEIHLYHKMKGMSSSREIELTVNILKSNYAARIAHTIQNPTDEDAGLYTCVAFNEDGIEMTSKKAVLTEPLNVTTNIQGWDYEVYLDYAIILCFIL